MSAELLSVLENIEREKGISRQVLIESIEADERKHVILLKGLMRLIEEKEKSGNSNPR